MLLRLQAYIEFDKSFHLTKGCQFETSDQMQNIGMHYFKHFANLKSFLCRILNLISLVHMFKIRLTLTRAKVYISMYIERMQRYPKIFDLYI